MKRWIVSGSDGINTPRKHPHKHSELYRDAPGHLGAVGTEKSRSWFNCLEHGVQINRTGPRRDATKKCSQITPNADEYLPNTYRCCRWSPGDVCGANERATASHSDSLTLWHARDHFGATMVGIMAETRRSGPYNQVRRRLGSVRPIDPPGQHEGVKLITCKWWIHMRRVVSGQPEKICRICSESCGAISAAWYAALLEMHAARRTDVVVDRVRVFFLGSRDARSMLWV